MDLRVIRIVKIGFGAVSEAGDTYQVCFDNGQSLSTDANSLRNFDFVEGHVHEMFRRQYNLHRPVDESWADHVARIYRESMEADEKAKADAKAKAEAETTEATATG